MNEAIIKISNVLVFSNPSRISTPKTAGILTRKLILNASLVE